MVDHEQLSILDQIDSRAETAARIKKAKIRTRLEDDYIHASDKYGYQYQIPDGTVLIYQYDKWLSQKMQTESHYYRVVVGRHNTCSGPMVHLISAPNDEWPDVPVWQYDERHGCQWIYPDNMTLWVKREPEMDPAVRWSEDD